MNEIITVLLIDDHDVIRDGLRALLHRHADIRVIGEAESGKEGVFQYFELSPRVVVCDLQIPDKSGDAIVTAIRERDPDANILIYSNYDLEDEVRRCLQAGARGYVLKDLPRQAILEAIRTVAKSKQYVPERVAGKLSLSLQRERLTERELQVLGLIVDGHSNKQLAAALFISEATVKTHLNNILTKLGAQNRTEAVTEALKRGLTRLSE